MTSDPTIIAFKPVAKAGRSQIRARPAQIIIFPGVRIERREYELADRQSVKPGAFKTRRRIKKST